MTIFQADKVIQPCKRHIYRNSGCFTFLFFAGNPVFEIQYQTFVVFTFELFCEAHCS